MDLSLPLGRPDIYPDRPVTLIGFKLEVDAHPWLIAEAAHTLGSGLVDQSQKMTVAARAMADKKTVGHLS